MWKRPWQPWSPGLGVGKPGNKVPGPPEAGPVESDLLWGLSGSPGGPQIFLKCESGDLLAPVREAQDLATASYSSRPMVRTQACTLGHSLSQTIFRVLRIAPWSCDGSWFRPLPKGFPFLTLPWFFFTFWPCVLSFQSLHLKQPFSLWLVASPYNQGAESRGISAAEMPLTQPGPGPLHLGRAPPGQSSSRFTRAPKRDLMNKGVVNSKLLFSLHTPRPFPRAQVESLTP